MNKEFVQEHADKILENVNVRKIREMKFKVAVDMTNGSACVMDPYLFEKLGVKIFAINDTPDGKFTHNPEPLKENLLDLRELSKKVNADVGFAQDPDADRLVIIDEKSEVISEEYTLALAVENVMSKNQNQKIVVNLSTSRMSEDIAERCGGKCYYSKIGEGNVVEKMLLHDAIIGGEGGGGVIYPKINFARDSFIGIALILELLAERNTTISKCVAKLPRYFIKKDKWKFEGNIGDMYLALKNSFHTAKIDERDGLRLDFSDKSWIHLRPSNTEPIIRLIGEAKDEASIIALFNNVKNLLKNSF